MRQPPPPPPPPPSMAAAAMQMGMYNGVMSQQQYMLELQQQQQLQQQQLLQPPHQQQIPPQTEAPKQFYALTQVPSQGAACNRCVFPALSRGSEEGSQQRMVLQPILVQVPWPGVQAFQQQPCQGSTASTPTDAGQQQNTPFYLVQDMSPNSDAR
mmetsp:Transcript_57955/g.135516  ORF Transcript_57955/g.135516 Transcript_57955/m.135516 type:complete len:155 (+) Transcript_57955:20-484(+)